MSSAESPHEPVEPWHEPAIEGADDEAAGPPRPETPRTPFEPGSRRKLGGRGCAWMAGIGCGLVILAGLALVAAMAFNGDRILAWSLSQFEKQILVDVPEGFDEQEQTELRQAFAAARERIAAGDVDPQALQGFQSIMFELAFKPPGERTVEDYRRLLEALDRLSADEAPATESEERVPAARPAVESV